MYELINQQTADRIKDIMLNTGLTDKIYYKVENSGITLNAHDVSETNESSHFDNMQEFYILNDVSSPNVIQYKNSFSNLYINIGEWAYKTRLSEAHIVIGSDKFHSFCFQIELSQAVRDNENIYIIKNIENYAGNGAINRLYGNTNNDKSVKDNRRASFINQYKHKIIEFNNKRWICIDIINKNELFDEKKQTDIFHSLLTNIIQAMLLVESIRDGY